MWCMSAIVGDQWTDELNEYWGWAIKSPSWVLRDCDLVSRDHHNYLEVIECRHEIMIVSMSRLVTKLEPVSINSLASRMVVYSTCLHYRMTDLVVYVIAINLWYLKHPFLPRVRDLEFSQLESAFGSFADQHLRWLTRHESDFQVTLTSVWSSMAKCHTTLYGMCDGLYRILFYAFLPFHARPFSVSLCYDHLRRLLQ